MKRGNSQKNSHDLFYGQGAFSRTTEIKSKHMSNKPAGEIIKKNNKQFDPLHLCEPRLLPFGRSNKQPS